jgi:hypothetical protein
MSGISPELKNVQETRWDAIVIYAIYHSPIAGNDSDIIAAVLLADVVATKVSAAALQGVHVLNRNGC